MANELEGKVAIVTGGSRGLGGDTVELFVEEGQQIRVGDPLVPSEGDYYATTKIAAEREVRTGPLDWTILRLSAVIRPSCSPRSSPSRNPAPGRAPGRSRRIRWSHSAP